MSFVLALHAGWPIEVVYWGLFSTEFSSTTSSFLSFSVFLHTPDRSRFFRSRIFSSSHGSDLFSWKQRLQEETNSEPFADREDSGNKDTKGSKHSSWGFLGVVITITTPFTTHRIRRLRSLSSTNSLSFLALPSINFFYFFVVAEISFHAPRE